MYQDLHSRIKAVPVISPQALAATTNGATVDTLGYESCEFVIHVGTAFAGGGFDVTLQESDDGSTWTAVDAEETIGVLPSIVATDAAKCFRVGTVGKKRYQRPVLTETGTISAGTIGVTAILGHPENAPVADQST